MNDPSPARGGRYQGVGYFNGGLFAVVDPVELKLRRAPSLHKAPKTRLGAR